MSDYNKQRKSPDTSFGTGSGMATSQFTSFAAPRQPVSGGGGGGQLINCIWVQITGPQVATWTTLGGATYTGYPWQQVDMSTGVAVPIPGGLTSASTGLGAIDSNDPHGDGGTITTTPYGSGAITASPYPTGTVLQICQVGGLYSFGATGAMAVTDPGAQNPNLSNVTTYYNPKELFFQPGIRVTPDPNGGGTYDVALDLNAQDTLGNRFSTVWDIKFNPPFKVTYNTHVATIDTNAPDDTLQVLRSLASGTLDCSVSPPVLTLNFNTVTIHFTRGILTSVTTP